MKKQTILNLAQRQEAGMQLNTPSSRYLRYEVILPSVAKDQQPASNIGQHIIFRSLLHSSTTIIMAQNPWFHRTLEFGERRMSRISSQQLVPLE